MAIGPRFLFSFFVNFSDVLGGMSPTQRILQWTHIPCFKLHIVTIRGVEYSDPYTSRIRSGGYRRKRFDVKRQTNRKTPALNKPDNIHSISSRVAHTGQLTFSAANGQHLSEQAAVCDCVLTLSRPRRSIAVPTFRMQQ